MVDLIHGLTAADVTDNLARVHERLVAADRRPEDVEILAAVKYLPEPELGALYAGGITLAGENRAQDLVEKAAAHPDFTWDFIGQLQSRKVQTVLPLVRYIHSLASESALAQIAKHATPETQVLIEVNVAGEDAKAGIAPGDLGDFIDRCAAQVVGLMTMPPYTTDPEQNRRHFARLAELAAEHDLTELSMGTSQDYGVAAEEGATIIRLGSTLFARTGA
jgi:PLP dependent protein